MAATEFSAAGRCRDQARLRPDACVVLEPLRRLLDPIHGHQVPGRAERFGRLLKGPTRLDDSDLRCATHGMQQDLILLLWLRALLCSPVA